MIFGFWNYQTAKIKANDQPGSLYKCLTIRSAFSRCQLCCKTFWWGWDAVKLYRGWWLYCICVYGERESIIWVQIWNFLLELQWGNFYDGPKFNSMITMKLISIVAMKHTCNFRITIMRILLIGAFSQHCHWFQPFIGPHLWFSHLSCNVYCICIVFTVTEAPFEVWTCSRAKVGDLALVGRRPRLPDHKKYFGYFAKNTLQVTSACTL